MSKQYTCPYCTPTNPNPLISEFLSVAKIQILKSADGKPDMPVLNVNNDFCRINFCPVCGRSLNEKE